jgi:hypothetical protein
LEEETQYCNGKGCKWTQNLPEEWIKKLIESGQQGIFAVLNIDILPFSNEAGKEGLVFKKR